MWQINLNKKKQKVITQKLTDKDQKPKNFIKPKRRTSPPNKIQIIKDGKYITPF